MFSLKNYSIIGNNYIKIVKYKISYDIQTMIYYLVLNRNEISSHENT